ncbi:MAG: LysR substrate-binding domain-containing protein [Bradymonadia bacterium]
MEDPALRDIRLFVAAVQHGSLSAGSRVFNLSANAASVSVKRLEEMLGVQLLLRTTRAISLTAEGEIYLEQCRLLLEAVEAAQSSVGPLRDELVGPVRVSAPSDLGRYTLMPMLDAFLEQHPGVRLDLWLSDDVYDVVDTRIDISIRYGALEDAELVARRLYRDRRVAVASPEYVERHPPITHPAHLAQHKALIWHRPGRALNHWGFSQDDEYITVEVSGHRSANDGVLLRNWAIEGHGVVFKCGLDVRADLEAGDLVDVLPEWSGSEIPLHLVLPGRGPKPARVQRLVSALVEGFAQIPPP